MPKKRPQDFSMIMHRCKLADLRMIPSKITFNIRSASIFGFRWSNGKLSPDKHGLDVLAHCDLPKTVSGLRSWIGAIKWHMTCLHGAKLAAINQLLNAQIPSSRQGREEIKWTSELTAGIKDFQKILMDPKAVTIPRKGDTPYVVTDSCISLPDFKPSWYPRIPSFIYVWPQTPRLIQEVPSS